MSSPSDEFSELIAVASQEGEIWTPGLVRPRLVEAMEIISYTAGAVGPKGYGSGLPGAIIDLLGAPDPDGETEWWLRPGAERDTKRRSYPAWKVTRAEAASRWPAEYLVGWEGPRRALLLWLRCKVHKKPFSRACMKRKWPRATANRAVDKALGLIAQGLNRDGVMVA